MNLKVGHTELKRQGWQSVTVLAKKLEEIHVSLKREFDPGEIT